MTDISFFRWTFSSIDMSCPLTSTSAAAYTFELQALSSRIAMLKTGSFERTKYAANCNGGIGLEVKSKAYRELIDPLLSPQNSTDFTALSLHCEEELTTPKATKFQKCVYPTRDDATTKAASLQQADAIASEMPVQNSRRRIPSRIRSLTESKFSVLIVLRLSLSSSC
ncbi:hypothetical protein V8G54_035423 [Vigna mungo]|uniref:Uncharacterized protein n=1 Tax=Vigna mungo TaxID=3915 RepID=A0AAQ3MGL2_VIGMU